MIKLINADRRWRKAQFAARFILVAGALVVINAAGNSGIDQNAPVLSERPHSIMGWKSKEATRSQKEQILQAARERVNEVEAQAKAEMEAAAKGGKK
jgi:hypothetical protein